MGRLLVPFLLFASVWEVILVTQPPPPQEVELLRLSRRSTWTSPDKGFHQMGSLLQACVQQTRKSVVSKWTKRGEANHLLLDITVAQEQETSGQPDPLQVHVLDSDYPSSEVSEHRTGLDLRASQPFPSSSTHLALTLQYSSTYRSLSLGPLSRTGFQLGLSYTGKCVLVSSIRVYYRRCPDMVLALSSFSRTVAGSGRVRGSCVQGAEEVAPPVRECSVEGVWGPQQGQCICRPGHQPVTDTCQACGIGFYRAANQSEGCQRCPPHSGTDREGSDKCDCVPGFSRLPSDPPELGCTKPPSAPVNLTVHPYNDSQLILWWDAPLDWGGRSEMTYRVLCERREQDGDQWEACDDGVLVLPDSNSLTSTSVNLTGVSPHQHYRLSVQARNDISNLQGAQHSSTATVTLLRPCGIGFYRAANQSEGCQRCPPHSGTDREGSDKCDCVPGFSRLPSDPPELGCTKPPSAPVNLTVHPYNDSLLILLWDAPLDWGGRSEMTYRVLCERREQDGDQWEACDDGVLVLPDSNSLTSTSVNLTGVSPHQHYRLSVQARNDISNLQGAQHSSTATVTLLRPCGIGFYRAANQSEGCQRCPPHSGTDREGSDKCDCVPGFSRLPSDPPELGCTKPPSAPVNLTVHPYNDSQLILWWDAPLDWGGRSEMTYRVLCERREQDGDQWEACDDGVLVLPDSNSLTSTSVNLTGVSPHQHYRLSVQARNDISNLQGAQHSSTATVTLLRPCGIGFYRAANQSEGCQRCPPHSGTDREGSDKCDCVPGFSRLPSDPPELGCTKPPSAPVNLTVHPYNDSLLILLWDAPLDWGGRSEMTYRVLCERREQDGDQWEACDDGVLVLPDSNSLTSTSVNLTGVSPHQHYRLSVQARNDISNLQGAQHSSTATVTLLRPCGIGFYRAANQSEGCQRCPPHSGTDREGSDKCDCVPGFSRLPSDPPELGCTKPPSAPVNLTVHPYNDSLLILWWDAPLDWGGRSEMTYRVLCERREQDGDQWEACDDGVLVLPDSNSLTSTSVNLTGVSPHQHYRLSVQARNDISNLQGAQHSSTATVTLLRPCGIGFYRAANQSEGCQRCPPHSGTDREGSDKCDCVPGFSRLPSDPPELGCTKPPSAPVNLTVHPYNDSLLILLWDAPLDWGGRSEMTYRVLCERREQDGDQWEACDDGVLVLPDSNSLTSTSVNLTGVSPHQHYRLSVQARNDISNLQGAQHSSTATVTLHRPCGIGFYRAANQSEGCQRCPPHSGTDREGSDKCDCVPGFSRLPSDPPELGCTKPPSAPVNLTVHPYNDSQLILWWDAPLDWGGRSEMTYRVLCERREQDGDQWEACDDGVLVLPDSNSLTSTSVNLTGVSPHQHYRLSVQARNDISNLQGAQHSSTATVTLHRRRAPPVVTIVNITQNPVAAAHVTMPQPQKGLFLWTTVGVLFGVLFLLAVVPSAVCILQSKYSKLRLEQEVELLLIQSGMSYTCPKQTEVVPQ